MSIFLKDLKNSKLEEPEKILFAISYHGRHVCPIYASGKCVEQEVYEGLTDTWDNIMSDQPEDEGLWVWEGIVYYTTDYYGEVDGPEFDKGKWRLPTPEEWFSISQNKSPWESRAHEFYLEETLKENESWI